MITKRVRVRAPASCANIGAGFDALGLALDLNDDVDIEAEFDGPGQELSIKVEGMGATSVPRDERHLVAMAMRATFAEAGRQPSALRLSCRNTVPHGRGLGSSAAAIVTGVVAAGALLGDPVDRDSSALQLASRLEGHPDNVASCLLGGLTIAWLDAWGVVRATRVNVHPDVHPIVCIPTDELSTKEARRLLPATVPHRDAALNAGRAALVVEALSRQPDLLFDATEDQLHQQYREPAMPRTIALVTALRKAGMAAAVSGAGPSVLVLGTPDLVPTITTLAAEWDVRLLDINHRGVQIEYLD
jgi:homoserine kinase